MPSRVIRSEADFDALGRLLASLERPFTATWTKGEDRSLQQNHLQFLWAREFSAAMGDRTLQEVRADWKLRHGVPILRADDANFRALYDAQLKGLPHEEKLKWMAYLPVSSLMTVGQMTEYLNAIATEAAGQGVRLTDPETAR